MEPWQRLDAASEREARDLLRTCNGSTRWIEHMLRQRPFGGRDALLAAARNEWFALSSSDWLEAFAHHPEIGDRESLRRRFAGRLSEQEQAGVAAASEDVLAALAEGNRAYREKFGLIFIVCATGKGASEILELLKNRLLHTRELELKIAAEEQARITELRLLGL